MLYEIRRIQVWSVMKVAFVIFAILGLIVGFFSNILFYTLFSPFFSHIMADLGDTSEFGSMTGLSILFVSILSAILWAIFYAVFGSLMAALFAGIYNLMARGFGGIELHLEAQTSPSVPSPSSSPGTAPPPTSPKPLPPGSAPPLGMSPPVGME
jgi:hypothetical protein